LFLLGSNAIVLVKEIKECTLWFFQRRIRTGFKVSQVGEDAFFELFRILDRSPERLKAERKASNDIRTRYVEEIIPN
jgi:hypothetical protein